MREGPFQLLHCISFLGFFQKVKFQPAFEFSVVFLPCHCASLKRDGFTGRMGAMSRRAFPAICCRQPGKVKFDPVVRMLSMLSSVFFFLRAKLLEVCKKLVPLHWGCFKISYAIEFFLLTSYKWLTPEVITTGLLLTHWLDDATHDAKPKHNLETALLYQTSSSQ